MCELCELMLKVQSMKIVAGGKTPGKIEKTTDLCLIINRWRAQRARLGGNHVAPLCLAQLAGQEIHVENEVRRFIFH